MTEQESKGFKIIDKRAMSDEERAKAEPPPPASAPPPIEKEKEGNRGTAAGVQGEKDAGSRAKAVGGPTFLDLVGMLQFEAMVNLGMMKTQEGERSPVDLPAAKDPIDLLGVLQEKTKGNLAEEESRALSEGLYHLRMAYMSLLNAGGKPGGKQK
jgi:hypothetical protein